MANWKNAVPKKPESVAYINKNSVKTPEAEKLADAMLAAVTSVMNDLKAKGLMFTEEKDGKTYSSKASVSVSFQFDKTQQPTKVPTSRGYEESYPVKKDEQGNDRFWVQAKIMHGTQNITLSAVDSLDQNGKARITSISWGEYNHANPSKSLSARGFSEIAAQERVTPELRAMVEAIQQGGYVRPLMTGVSIDPNLDRSDKIAAALADGMAKAVGEVMKQMKADGKLFPVTGFKDGQPMLDENGEKKQFQCSAFITVEPNIDQSTGKQKTDDEGNPRYWVRARISDRENNESLEMNASDKIQDGSVTIVGLNYSRFEDGGGGERATSNGIQNSSASAQFKALAAAIMAGGFIHESSDRSEMEKFSIHLNKDVFKQKVVVERENQETGKTEDVERKLVNAHYEKDEKGVESISLFNKSDAKDDEGVLESASVVRLFESERHGNGAMISNAGYTFVGEGKDCVPKSSPEDKSAFFYLDCPENIAAFLPNSNPELVAELVQAVCEWTGIDIEQVKDCIENNAAEQEQGTPDAGIDDFQEVTEPEDIPQEFNGDLDVD